MDLEISPCEERLTLEGSGGQCWSCDTDAPKSWQEHAFFFFAYNWTKLYRT